jgi:protein associated with RNAse G/E
MFGRWLGIRRGDPWWTADHSRFGVFEQSFVKLVPSGTYWTACFNATNPMVDIDIVLPVCWVDTALEEVDLELDILRSADGSVHIRDQDAFDRVRVEWNMPRDIATHAEATCTQVRVLVEQGTEPFNAVGHRWLTRFLAEIDAA